MAWWWFAIRTVLTLCGVADVDAAGARQPEGTLSVAVATFGSERWLPPLYVGAEDLVYKPM